MQPARRDPWCSKCQDPFDLDDIPDHLMNITTGQIASREVEDSMRFNAMMYLQCNDVCYAECSLCSDFKELFRS